jgi:hypothetical protein
MSALQRDLPHVYRLWHINVDQCPALTTIPAVRNDRRDPTYHKARGIYFAVGVLNERKRSNL